MTATAADLSIVVPLFNEGKSIYDTILSFRDLDYPKEKLTVIVVDDCSTDDSYEWACKAAAIFTHSVAASRYAGRWSASHLSNDSPSMKSLTM